MNQVKIGEFIKSLRKAKGLSQQQVADALLVTQKTVSRWENGEGIPDISIIKDVANYFDITVDELLDGEIKNKEESCSTIKRKETNRTRLISNKLSNVLSKAIYGAIGSFGLFILIAIIILAATKDDFLTITFNTLGLFVAIIIYLLFYFDTKNKLKEKDNEYVDINEIKSDLRLKTILFLDLFMILFFISATLNFIVLYVTFNTTLTLPIFLKYYGLISIIISSYFLIRPMIKEGKINKQLLYKTLTYEFMIASILSILYLLNVNFVYGSGVIINGIYAYEVYECLPLYRLLTLNGAGMNVFRIIGFIIMIASIILVIIFGIKNKFMYSLLFTLTGIIGDILMLFDHLFRLIGESTFNVGTSILSLIILFVSIAIVITYFTLKYKERKQQKETI